MSAPYDWLTRIMKRTERQHLKENEFAHLAASAREGLEERGGQLAKIAIAVVVVLVAVIGFSVYRNSTASRAGQMLGEAMAIQDARVGAPDAPGTPSTGPSYPNEKEKVQAMLTKFKAVADAYPGTDEGNFARYREAGAQMALGNAKDAAAAYEKVIGAAGDSIYGQMAKLGLAEAQARNGEFDKAIDTFKSLSANKDGALPVDGILLQLARTYRDAGKSSDAEQTFNRLVEEFPDSQFAADAKKELDAIKKG